MLLFIYITSLSLSPNIQSLRIDTQIGGIRFIIYISCVQDSQPRGSIELVPGSWCEPVTQGTPKLPDAQLTSNGSNDSTGVVSVV